MIFVSTSIVNLKQHFLHVCHGTDQTIIDSAIDEWHVCRQKADTLSNYCDNIQPYDETFQFLSNVTGFLDCFFFFEITTTLNL